MHKSKHDYEKGRMSQSCWHKSVSMMTWSSARLNHADDDINKPKNEKERGEETDSGLSLLDGDAQNIATYKLVPDHQEDPFVIGYHVL